MRPAPITTRIVPLDCQHAVLLAEKMRANALLEATFTSDGQFLVTETKMKFELEEAVRADGGRASLRQVQAVLGVDEVTTYTVMRNLCSETTEIQLVEYEGIKELVTEAYVDSLVPKAVDMTTTRGRVTLAELSSTFKVPKDFTERFVNSRILGPAKHGSGTLKVVNSDLVAKSYEMTKKVEIRDLCSSATEPVSVKDLLTSCDLQPEEADMAVALLQELTQCGEIRGALTGGHVREFVPNSFLIAQREQAVDFFLANGYLDDSTAQGLQIHKLHQFAKEVLPTAECLMTAVVSREVVEQLEAVADEAVAQGTWFEAWSVVPTVLSEADAAHLVGLCSACRRAGDDPLRLLQLAEVYGASAQFLNDLVERFRADTWSQVNTAAATGAANTGDEEVPRRNVPTRKSGGRARTRKRDKRDAEGGQIFAEEVCSFVLTHIPELEDHPSFVSALGERLFLPFRDVQAEAVRRVKGESSNTGTGDVLERAEALDRTFEREYPSFQLCCHGLMALRQALRHRTAPKNTLDPVGEAKKCTPARKEFSSATASDPEDPQIWAETYLLRTRGAKLADLITAGECSKLDIAFASQDCSEGRGSERMPAITKEACSALVELLPGDVGRALANLWQAAMTGTEVSLFCDVLEGQVFPACNLVRRRLDKRKERQLLADEQRGLKEKLFRSISEREVLYFGTLLVFLHMSGALPLLPQPDANSSTVLQNPGDGQIIADSCGSGEDWSRILLRTIRGDTTREAQQALSDLQQIIKAVKYTPIAHGEKAALACDTKEGRPLSIGGDLDPSGEDEDFSVRLLRSTEAARAAALACGE